MLFYVMLLCEISAAQNIYKHIDSLGRSTFIDLNKSMTNGAYYGFCEETEGQIFYYKAEIINLKIEGNKIDFKTVNFRFSKKPIHPSSKNIKWIRDKTFICFDKDRFYGVIQGHKLLLKRIKKFSGSWHEDLEFIRVVKQY